MAAERGLKNRAWRRERLELAKMFVSVLKRTNLVSVFQKAAQRMAKAAPIQEKAEELQKQLLRHHQNKPETHDEWWEKELARTQAEIDKLEDDIEDGLRGPRRGLRGLAQGERGGPAAAATAPWCFPCR